MPRRRPWPSGAKHSGVRTSPVVQADDRTEGCSDADEDAMPGSCSNVDAGFGHALNLPAVADVAPPVAAPTLLQPRVAVVLGVPTPWHRPLFACRLLSVAPAARFGVPPTWRLLVRLHSLFAHEILAPGGRYDDGESLWLTETLMAILWCGASSYLSFFFTDCLMSRWLLNYTPQATIVRLLAVNAVNGYLTSWVLYLAGSSEDHRMLLPAWIAIATILTAIYHTTQRKINIRKETSISISVFSIASFISMLGLLAQAHMDNFDGHSHIPIVSLFMRIYWSVGRAFAAFPPPSRAHDCTTSKL